MASRYLQLKPQLNTPVVQKFFLVDHYYFKKIVVWALPTLQVVNVWEDSIVDLSCKVRAYSPSQVLLHDNGFLKVFDFVAGKVVLENRAQVHLDQVQSEGARILGLNNQSATLYFWKDISAKMLSFSLKGFKHELNYKLHLFPSGDSILAAADYVECYFVSKEAEFQFITLDQPASCLTQMSDKSTYAIACSSGVRLIKPNQPIKDVCGKLSCGYKSLIDYSDKLFYTLAPNQISAWKKPDFSLAMSYRAEGYSFSMLILTQDLLVACDLQGKQLVIWHQGDPNPIANYRHDLNHIQRILLLSQNLFCILRNVQTIIGEERIFIHRLEVIRLQDQVEIARKQIKNLKYRVDTASLTKGCGYVLLFICKNSQNAMILSWDYSSDILQQKKINRNAVIYPCNRILVCGETNQIYSHQFKNVVSFKTEHKPFILDQHRMAIVSSKQIQIFRTEGGIVKQLLKLNLSQPVLKMDFALWPDRQDLLDWLRSKCKKQLQVKDKYFLQGESSCWLWNQDFEIQDSKECLKRQKAPRVQPGGIVVRDGKLEVWPLQWAVATEDGFWWKDSLLTISKKGTYLRLIEVPQQILKS